MLTRCTHVALCFAGLLIAAQTASAARLLSVYIDRDGETLVHTYYEDGGQADAAIVWSYLATPPIMVDDDVTSLETTDEHPLTLELQGNLEIRIQHTTRVIARTPLSDLTLRRKDEQTQAWFLSAEEMERTAFVAGLRPAGPNEEERFDGFLATIAASLVILFGCILLTALLMRGPKSASAE